MLIGGKSRAVAVKPEENTRFISLCIRRSSTKGSKPNRGNSESAMVFPILAFWHECGGRSRLVGQAGKDQAHEWRDPMAAEVRSSRAAGTKCGQRRSHPHSEAT